MKNCIDDFELRRNLPEGAIGLIEYLRSALESCGISPSPRLSLLNISDDPDQDEWECELEVLISPGIILPTRCGLFELGDEPLTNDQIVETVLEGILAIRSELTAIGALLHEARVGVRKVLVQMDGDGDHVRLIDVKLAPYDDWRGSSTPAVGVVLEGLCDNLEPTAHTIPVASLSNLQAELQHYLTDFWILAAKRRQMMEHGASGIIDQLAVNALYSSGRIDVGVRRLRRETRFWLADETCIAIREGHARAATGDPHADVQWMESEVSVRRTFMAESVLVAAIGKPLSQLFEHPYLTPDMIVEDASCSQEDGESTLWVRFRQRTHLFCSASGRQWLNENSKMTEPGGSGPACQTQVAKIPAVAA